MDNTLLAARNIDYKYIIIAGFCAKESKNHLLVAGIEQFTDAGLQLPVVTHQVTLQPACICRGREVGKYLDKNSPICFFDVFLLRVYIQNVVSGCIIISR